MNLNTIGQLVHRRRLVLGLSQARLAKFRGLSRATVNQLETGATGDLGAAKLIVLLDLLCMTLSASDRPTRQNALASASRTASVSYRDTLDPMALGQRPIAG